MLAALLVVGCPTYEDGYTGHYQETNIEEFQDQAVALDLFRFGDQLRGVLRLYDISSAQARQNPFDETNEVHCRWSRVEHFSEDDNSFTMTIPSTVEWERVELEGRIGDDGRVDVQMDDDNADGPRALDLVLTERSPDAECTTIGDFLIRAIFDRGENRFDPDVYELRHPVFAILWAGLLNRDDQSMVPINDPSPSFRFSETPGPSLRDNGLDGRLSVNVPPPAEPMLIESGDTRYALAHFVVIDDADGEGRFSWSISEEPIIATALERGLPDDAPEEVIRRHEEGDEPLQRWGRALLFVEGRIDELDETLLREVFLGVDEAEPDRHFYIVDIFSYYDDEVDFIKLPPRPEADRPIQRRIPVQVTDEYLDLGEEEEEVAVPRVYPVN